MKFYVASSFQNYENQRRVARALTEAGHVQTVDWTLEVDREAAGWEPTTSEWTEVAETDLQGVREADVVILLHPHRWGACGEFVAALALRKPVIMLGGTVPEDRPTAGKARCVFYHARDILEIFGALDEERVKMCVRAVDRLACTGELR